MGQNTSQSHGWTKPEEFNADVDELEEGVKTVVLIHGLASCALRGKTYGARGFLSDYCRQACDCAHEAADERLLYVSISQLAKRPHIVKSLALNWEPTIAKREGSEEAQKTFKTVNGYENAEVYPVQGLDGIRTLNPGLESDVTPIYLWHNIIEHLSEAEVNLLAFNYDWRRWGDVIYIAQLVPKFKELMERAVYVSGEPTIVVAHSLGAQVITYMMGFLGDQWTKAHISDVVLVGPATMGSPTVFAGYANGPSTVTHSSVLPVANFMEVRLRDVASTWPGMLSVLPTPLDGLDTFDGQQIASSPSRSYSSRDSLAFLEDLAQCDEKEGKHWVMDEARGLHEKSRRFLEDHDILEVKRLWKVQFHNAAMVRRAFESHVVPYLKPPNCRVHVIYTDAIDTLFKHRFQENLYYKASFETFVPGDDTITAASVDKMCEAWKAEGCRVFKHHAGKKHHKELISCPFTMKVMDTVLAGSNDTSSSEWESEDAGGCFAAG